MVTFLAGHFGFVIAEVSLAQTHSCGTDYAGLIRDAITQLRGLRISRWISCTPILRRFVEQRSGSLSVKLVFYASVTPCVSALFW